MVPMCRFKKSFCLNYYDDDVLNGMVTDVDIFLISILPRIYLTHARISCKSIKSNFGDNDENKKFHQLFLDYTSKKDVSV